MKDTEKTAKSLKNYARYTGLGFQMVGVIGLFTFIGYQVDQKRGADELIFTAIFGVIGVCLALYQVIRSVLKP